MSHSNAEGHTIGKVNKGGYIVGNVFYVKREVLLKTLCYGYIA